MLLNNGLIHIWKDLMDSDSGFHRMAYKDVYSVFKRRYQLKYTALEATDVFGYSVLFSLQTIPVSYRFF